MSQDPVVAQTRAVAKCVSCLCRPTTSNALLADYIPIFRFGVLSSAEAVTISINPAQNVPGYRQLPRVSDFGRNSRLELADTDLKEISLRCDKHFGQGDSHRFFDNLERIVRAAKSEWTYESGKLAHIDIVSCVTQETWSKIHPNAKKRALIQKDLQDNCHPHFRNTLSLLPSGCWLLCDGKAALNAVERVGAAIVVSDTVSNARMSATIFDGNLTLDNRVFRLTGWNRPAHQLRSIRPEEVGHSLKRIMETRNPAS